MPARYVCGDEERRAALCDPKRNPKNLNGIDFLEVVDFKDPAHPEWEPLRQRFLGLRFFKPETGFTAVNVRIEGGVRTPVRALEAKTFPSWPAGSEKDFLNAYFPPALQDDAFLIVHTDSTGDYSTYRLRLVEAPAGTEPPKNFDPRLSEVSFSFKVECPSDFDCHRPVVCPRPELTEPEISYLAKDYASFRRLMLDR